MIGLLGRRDGSIRCACILPQGFGRNVDLFTVMAVMAAKREL